MNMNRYESVLLDRMVEINKVRRQAVSVGETNVYDCLDGIILLLDCICDFREPPKGLAVEDGYGALVVSEDE